MMPMRRERYPADWEDISKGIREGRAGNRCEACGVANGATVIGVRGQPYRVVLTVAHLNHEPSDCRPENLRAWCQSCHLRYDASEHARHAAETRRRGRMDQGQPRSSPTTRPACDVSDR